MVHVIKNDSSLTSLPALEINSKLLTCAIETYRPLQVVNAEGNNCDAWFHGMTPSLGEDTMDWLIEAQRKLNYHQLKLVG